MSTVFRIEWTEVAEHDLTEIVDDVAGRASREAALRILTRLEEKAATLESMPHRGRIVPEIERFEVREYRELVVAPYRIIYRTRGNIVYILGIFDGRRDLEVLILRRLLSF